MSNLAAIFARQRIKADRPLVLALGTTQRPFHAPARVN